MGDAPVPTVGFQFCPTFGDDLYEVDHAGSFTIAIKSLKDDSIKEWTHGQWDKNWGGNHFRRAEPIDIIKYG